MISIKLAYIDRVESVLDNLSTATADLRQPMRVIAQGMATEVDLGFSREEDPWGEAWERLSDVTLSRRRGSSAQILSDTGVLSNSFHADSDNKSAQVGTNDKRAGTLQYGAKKGAYGRTSRGGPIPWGDIPPRAMVPIKDGRVDLPGSWVETVLDALTAHIELASK